MADNYRVNILKKMDVTDLVGEKVIINYEDGIYYMLTGSANEIWDMLDNGVETERIVASLTEIYEVEADECREGLVKFLNDLMQIGIISLEKCD